jgi:hypothetical protein
MCPLVLKWSKHEVNGVVFRILMCTGKLESAFFVLFFFLMCRNDIGAPQ